MVLMATRSARAVATLIVLALVLAACGSSASTPATGSTAGTTSAIKVLATTPIIADIARHVAGERLDVRSLMPAGADPHDYEPTPRDIEAAADADLILVHGLEYDAWAQQLVRQSGTSATLVTVTEGVKTLATQIGHHEEDGHDHAHDHGDIDPHVWLDVANVKVMATNIRDALIAADPDGREAFTTQADAYIQQLDELDAWIRTLVATLPEADRKLVTSHESFGYYAAAYGFTYIGTAVPSFDSKAQASAQQIDALVQQVEQEHVRAIFTESTISPDIVEAIGKEAGITVVRDLYSDTLTDNGSETDTYIGIMRHNTTRIVEALLGD